MTRSDMHADAMLRHLGAAYYESLHGRATRADVARALETVEEHLNERPEHPHPVRKPRAAGGHDRLRHPRGWSREVSDVMTTSVITVDRITPYKEIARLLASGPPLVFAAIKEVAREAEAMGFQEAMNWITKRKFRTVD